MTERRAARISVAGMLLALSFAEPAGASKPGLPHILPAELETRIALSAAPKHLQDAASVYLLAKDGYRLSRRGSNGFSCLVIRGPGLGPPHWDDAISGWCYDDHGMDTIGRVQLDRAKYRRAGLSPEEIREKIKAGFASGHYRAPDRAGVIYMLSPINKVPDHRTGDLFDFVPHVMYYAPNTTNDDIGVPESQHTGDTDYVWSGLPFLPTTGPHGFIVQALGEKESSAIINEYHTLIDEVAKYIDLDIRYDTLHECAPTP